MKKNASGPLHEAPPLVDCQNPWPGLESFREEHYAFFHGRDTEREELRRHIGRAKLTLFFGKSGLGKSSLVQAGLFPVLRVQRTLPVYCRLDHRETASPLARQLLDALLRECEKYDVKATAPLPEESLWEYLHRRDLELNAPGGESWTLLLAIDPFEELFTLGGRTEKSRSRSLAFIDELAAVVARRLPPDLAERSASHPELLDRFDPDRTRHGVIIILREDFLPVIERLNNRLPTLLQNRFRLEPMTESQAMRAVLKPVRAAREALQGAVKEGGAPVPFIVEEPVARKIVKAVSLGKTTQILGSEWLGGLSSAEEAEVNPALLSLFCRELNNVRLEAREEQITMERVEESREEILATFYTQSFGPDDDELRRWIEDKLLTEADYRHRAALHDALKTPGVTREALDRLNARHLLRYEEADRTIWIEIAHDVLADPIAKSRALRREREQRERAEREREVAQAREREIRGRLQWAVAAIVCILALLMLAVYLERKATEARNEAIEARNEATEAFNEAIDQRNKAYLAQAALSFAAWKDGRIGRAVDLLGDSAKMALAPHDRVQKSSDPRSWEWYFVSGLSDLSQSSSSQTNAEPDNIKCLIPLPKSTSHFVTAESDGQIQLWEAATGKKLLIADADKLSTDFRISYERKEDSRLVQVTEILPGSSAAKDGRLRVGDKILRIARPDGNMADISSLKPNQLNDIMSSPAGSKLLIEVQHGNNSCERIELARAAFPIKGSHSAEILSLAASPDGRFLVSADADGWLFVWDVSDPARPRILRRSQSLPPILQMAYDPKGRYLATVKEASSEVILWSNNIPSKTIDAKAEIVWLAFSPDGRLATETAETGVKLWDIESHEELWSYNSDSKDYWEMSFAKGAGNLCVLLGGKALLFSEEMLLAANAVPLELKEDSTYEYAVALNEQGTLLATGGSDGVVRVWTTPGGSLLLTLAGHRAPVEAVAFDESGQYLASTGMDKTLRIWNLRQKPPTKFRKVELSGSVPLGIAYSADGLFIAVTDPDAGDDLAMTDMQTGGEARKTGLITILDSASGEKLREIRGSVVRFDFFPKDPFLPIPNVDGTIRLVDVRDGSDVRVFKGHTAEVKQAVFSSDGTQLLSGGADGTVRLWDVEKATHRILKKFEDPICAVAISPKGDQAACAVYQENKVVLFNLKSGEINELQPPVSLAKIGSLQFSNPEDALLVVGEINGGIRVWDTLSRNEKRRFSGHTGQIWSLAFSPDGRRLLSSANDRRTLLWDVKSRRELFALEDSTNIYAGTFSKDGLRVALTSQGSALLYDAAIFASPEEKTKPLLRARAKYRTDLEQWKKAIRDLSQAINEGGSNTDLLWMRANAYAEAGDLDSAIIDIENVHKCATSIEDASVRVRLCAALFGRWAPDDREVYFDHLRKLIEFARGDPTPENVNSAAWYASLRPDPPSDIDLHALAVALDKARASTPPSSDAAYDCASTYGTLLYRAGDFAAALKALSHAMSLKPNSPGGDDGGTPFDWVILSMCHSRLNNPDSARKWLSKTEDRLRQVKKDPFYDDPVWDWTWEQRMQIERLLGEAHDLLRGDEHKAK